MAVRSKEVNGYIRLTSTEVPNICPCLRGEQVSENPADIQEARKHQIKHIRKQGGWKEKMGFAALGTFLLSKP